MSRLSDFLIVFVSLSLLFIPSGQELSDWFVQSSGAASLALFVAMREAE